MTDTLKQIKRAILTGLEESVVSAHNHERGYKMSDLRQCQD